MKKIIFGLFAMVALLFTSCNLSKEATSNVNNLETSVILNQNNYKVIGQVSGESKQTYVLGIGGMSKKSMAESAMSEMMKNADLKGGARAIINTNIQYKEFYFLLGFSRKAIATGTIIEFTK